MDKMNIVDFINTKPYTQTFSVNTHLAEVNGNILKVKTFSPEFDGLNTIILALVDISTNKEVIAIKTNLPKIEALTLEELVNFLEVALKLQPTYCNGKLHLSMTSDFIA